MQRPVIGGSVTIGIAACSGWGEATNMLIAREPEEVVEAQQPIAHTATVTIPRLASVLLILLKWIAISGIGVAARRTASINELIR
jgi:hypothetical protein